MNASQHATSFLFSVDLRHTIRTIGIHVRDLAMSLSSRLFIHPATLYLRVGLVGLFVLILMQSDAKAQLDIEIELDTGHKGCGPCKPVADGSGGGTSACLTPSGEVVFKQCDIEVTDNPPIEGDDDGDGIVDAYEDYLLNKFAPKIWLAYNENRWPVNVDWLLSYSTLRYSHIRCSDHEIVPSGQVTRQNITEQRHRNAKDPLASLPWQACRHYGPINRSDSYTATPKRSFFLQYPDSAHTGQMLTSAWQIYGHVYTPINGGGYVIQYWQLYSFNDSFASFNHEGDWEYTAVHINQQEIPLRVIHSQHGRHQVSAPSQVDWEGDHHITYSAKGSHAQYRTWVQNYECVADSLEGEIQGFADKCSPGTAWNSWEPEFGGIVNIGEKNRPLNNANWIRYSGRWGEIGELDDTSGPQGPAYQPKHWLWAP